MFFVWKRICWLVFVHSAFFGVRPFQVSMNIKLSMERNILWPLFCQIINFNFMSLHFGPEISARWERAFLSPTPRISFRIPPKNLDVRWSHAPCNYDKFLLNELQTSRQKWTKCGEKYRVNWYAVISIRSTRSWLKIYPFFNVFQKPLASNPFDINLIPLMTFFFRSVKINNKMWWGAQIKHRRLNQILQQSHCWNPILF